MDRPVLTLRAVALLGAGVLPAVVGVLAPGVALFAWGLDLAVLALVTIDFLLAPRALALSVQRHVEPILSAGRANPVTLELTLAWPGARAISGELRDFVSPGPAVHGHRQRFVLDGVTRVEWALTPATRGELDFAGVWLRLDGPLGLCARQAFVPLPQRVKVYPDLSVLAQDALTLARSEDRAARRVVRLRSEGREFESLREYRPGDDRRSIDWKATARRGRPFVRLHQPERNQQVLLLLDCGRHMAGEIDGRRKLDHAVDATLRLARVALAQGDLVGVLAFGAEVKAWLPPRKGVEHLRAIAEVLYRVDATLEDSDYGAAIDRAFARGARRSLVVVLTDLLDPDAAQALLLRTRRLVPRHLPLVVSLQDQALHAAATALPETPAQAYERLVAGRLEDDSVATVARLREAGARVVRGPPARFAADSVNAYLELKERGAL